jgi:hypothetical protein
MNNFFLAVVLTVCFSSFELVNAQSLYKVGVGIADATGPAAEINMV